jgi:hypothetical protein
VPIPLTPFPRREGGTIQDTLALGIRARLVVRELLLIHGFARGPYPTGHNDPPRAQRAKTNVS